MQIITYLYVYININNSRISGEDLVPVKCIKSSAVVDLLLIVTPTMRFCNCSMFCCALLYAHSSFAIIFMGKRELVALLSWSSWYLVIVVWLFLTVPCVFFCNL